MTYLSALNAAFEALQVAYDAIPEGHAFHYDREAIAQALNLLNDPIYMQESIEHSAKEQG